MIFSELFLPLKLTAEGQLRIPPTGVGGLFRSSLQTDAFEI